MNDQSQMGIAAAPKSLFSKARLMKVRWTTVGMVLGLLVGAWVVGGPDRYGEEDSFIGGFRGAARTMTKGLRYAAATFRDCLAFDRSSVRRLGLAQQIENRLWQDKRLVAEGIVIEVEEEGTVILKGIVPDEDNKEKAVSLARDTRGVERVVDELALRPSSRTITATPAAAVPTGVAARAPFLR